MRAWTKSACVVLAWSILPIILVAVSIKGSAHPAQANTRIASSTEVILTSTSTVAAASVSATTHTTRYVVRSGDTLSAIATRFAVRGGWPALYAANRQAIGPDPNVIHSGTVLVLPGVTTPIHYMVAAGDTLSGIAAEFAVRGGWPALYAANRQAVGPEPDILHAGTVLTIPRLAAPSPPTPGRVIRRYHPPTPPPPLSAGPRLVPKTAPAATGMPRWLKTVLLAVGLLILVAFLAEPVVSRRRRLQVTVRRTNPSKTTPQEAQPAETTAQESRPLETTLQQAAVQHDTVLPARPSDVGTPSGPACWRTGASRARIVLADYDRLVVTRSKPDETVYVLRPPNEDPRAILRVARLVLPEGPYGELAKQLGMPAIGPVE
jgi:LysM repeat protein